MLLRKIYNSSHCCVILLGLGFFGLFSAFNTAEATEISVINDFLMENSDFKGSAYTSLAIVYIVFAVCNWVAPSILVVTGIKWGLFLASISYTIYMANFFKPILSLFYGSSVLLGLSAAVLWTAQGAYLAAISDPSSTSINSALFQALYESSSISGVLPMYIFSNQTYISSSLRFQLFGILCGISLLANFLFLLLPNSKDHSKSQSEIKESTTSIAADQPLIDSTGNLRSTLKKHRGNIQKEVELILTQSYNDLQLQPGRMIVQSAKLFTEKKMMLLFWAFFYSGIELTFCAGIYSTCIGNTAVWPNSRAMIGLTGIFEGVGQIIASFFGGLSRRVLKIGGDTVFLTGSLLQMISFYLIFLNLPAESALNRTTSIGFLNPNSYLGVACGFFLGFGDACIETELSNMLIVNYEERSTIAFALFKFAQSLSCAIGFFCSPYMDLYYQLMVLLVFNVVSCLCFFAASAMKKPTGLIF